MQIENVADLFGTAQQMASAGQAPQAAALYRDWLARHPSDPLGHAVYFNYGVLLSGLDDLAGAAAAFGEAIKRNATFLPPFINLGVVYERLGATEPAISHWAHATATLAAVSGDSLAYKTTALKHIARVLESVQRHAQAEEHLRQIIEIAPTQRDVVQHWISLRQRQCAWPLLEPVGALDRPALLRGMAPLSLVTHTDDPMLALALAASYSRAEFGVPADFRTDADFAARPPSPRLRIGYLSSDLRSHAIGHLTADMYRLHDRDRYEVFVYYCGIPQEDAVKARIRGSVEHWCDITPMDDDAALARMLADGIDILVDINGHTRGARTRLLSRRPAPVIVNWLGYAGTMGTPYHHYILGDEVIIPAGSERYYSEAVRRLPCYQPNDRHRTVGAVPTRAALGLPEDAVVFCSFNGTQKITPFGFDRWMQVLRGVPGSVLWLLKSSDAVDVKLRERAQAAGIDPARLIFAPMAGNADHVARYAAADLFLDTAPYGAHTTASDALWMGTPVLTLPGRGFASRVCASLVRAAGVPELVCDTPADYVAQAIALGQDPARLRAYRPRLLAFRETSLLYDTQNFVRHIEQAFDGMWQDFREGRLPRPDLSNLDTYLDLGAAEDHEAQETGTLPDYEARWQQRLARRHAFQKLPPDGRLWSPP
ncbi:O-linked N-acetylglucosamine transferase, SPINDLY family protein [Falsiroseomonas tokyonensis]|uniref:protein O-GlcNAc transferase n=1 Tax=Falsiroseomonas tokyonensis TaxID=430521 RepID=A0ABV7BQP6_9PROT|nr:tetratricopeptide repeat protein [Falsiroseomonas tokyonensis]